MQSIKNRLGDKITEVLDYTRKYGRSAAMDYYGIKDYICFDRFLKEETDEPNFGVAPIIRPYIKSRPLDLQYLDECSGLLSRIKARARLDAQIARKKRRIEELEQMLFAVRELPDEVDEPCEVKI